MSCNQWEMSIERSQQQAEVARQQAVDVSQHKLQQNCAAVG